MLRRRDQALQRGQSGEEGPLPVKEGHDRESRRQACGGRSESGTRPRAGVGWPEGVVS